MDVQSHLHSSSSTSSSAAEAYLTSQSFTNVISHYDVTAPCYCECWDSAGSTSDTHHGTTLDDCGRTFDVMRSQTQDASDANHICDVMTSVAAEPPRSDVTSSAAPSQELTQLSSLGVKRESVVYNDHHFANDDVTQQQFPVGTYSDVIVKRDDERHHDDRMTSETTQPLLPTQHLPSSDDVETYFSAVDRPQSIDTFITQLHHHQHRHHLHRPHHHHHHGYYQHQQQYAEQLMSQVSFSSSTLDVKPQFYSSLYNYSTEQHHHHQHVREMPLPLQHSLVTTGNYHDSVAAAERMLNGESSLTGLVSVHTTTSEMPDTCRSMLSYSPSTTLSQLLAESHGDSGVSGSFSALLHSSPVTPHVDVDLSAHYSGVCDGVDNGDQRRVSVIDSRQAADVTDTDYNVTQPSSCYDDQLTAWNSSGIVTLMKSFVGTVAEYLGLSRSYCALDGIHSFYTVNHKQEA